MASVQNIGTTACNSSTTEWDDIQRRIGNLPPLVEQALAVEAAAAATAPEQASRAGTSDDGQRAHDKAGAACDAGGDDDDDSSELARIRAERLDELRGLKPARFGSILEITRTDYVTEVNKAPEGVGVVVFLFKRRHYLSSYMLVLLEKLARKFGDVKFGFNEVESPGLWIFKRSSCDEFKNSLDISTNFL